MRRPDVERELVAVCRLLPTKLIGGNLTRDTHDIERTAVTVPFYSGGAGWETCILSPDRDFFTMKQIEEDEGTPLWTFVLLYEGQTRVPGHDRIQRWNNMLDEAWGSSRVAQHRNNALVVGSLAMAAALWARAREQ